MQRAPPSHPAAVSVQPPTESRESTSEAPPKQVALAMERLGHAGRLIADIRLSADRLLEALFVTAQPHQANKSLNLILKEETSTRQHLEDLRIIGRQLEESGVINESLRSRSNSWGLHMPLVCPDGAVVAYAWKRQLAGQAGASAVDRTRLALKAFTDQKRRFFPHLDCNDVTEPASKKHSSSQVSTISQDEEGSGIWTLSDLLSHMGRDVPNIKITTYQRLDWSKRASSLPSSSNNGSNNTELTTEHAFHTPSKLRPGSAGVVPVDKVAVIELFLPSVFRALVSLHPAGSINPDAVAFFSPDEGGSYIHSRGASVYHVYKHMKEHGDTALQYFLGLRPETALHSLLHWICNYQGLFSKTCSKCGRLLSLDKQLALVLPPVHRPYRNLPICKASSNQHGSSTRDQNSASSSMHAYHINCSGEER
ncbi:mediator of RNA polymerase II transcription subunit 27 [Impatiens glandulifera]|uniref:mediator of RNA polymerase II transcription subunit 27 n=1 Tax=Impatiens glandulifera TaxID=253017 RepID=UPI001FB073AD|nr:mediator of RNA polymerase II transcription subunit 27 [Impatiens glandulifera]